MMKLSRIYSNHEEIFATIDFNDGLNVILAEIRLPENFEKDTHNLGKSTFRSVLDFCFLVKKNKKSFLFKNPDLFDEFEFFLELKLDTSSFLTIQRSVKQATRISFKRHSKGKQKFSDQSDEIWDHLQLPFEKARSMLDAYINWQAIKPWGFRKGISYLLRSQEDYSEVFQLKKFAGKHSDWKPYLAHLLGFSAQLVSEHYEAEDELDKKKQTEAVVEQELGGSIEDSSKIEGLLLLKQKDVEKKEKLLSELNFSEDDNEVNKRLVHELDQEIGEFNRRKYSLSLAEKKIEDSLKEGQVLFNPEKAEKLFQQTGVYFDGQLKKDFEQLIEFNKAITEERRAYLIAEKKEIDEELERIVGVLDALNSKRADYLQFLQSDDFREKFQKLSVELVGLKADIEGLDRRRNFVMKLQDLREDVRRISVDLSTIRSRLEKNIEDTNANNTSLFSQIRLHFSEFVESVIGRKALLEVKTNDKGHLEFSASILDEEGSTTSADAGHTYKKLLCIAFDLSVIRAHLVQDFPRFAFHDGAFESLDDRKTVNLLETVRLLGNEGIQHIITTIDSDLPKTRGESIFTNSEVILRLHDEGTEGRLFKCEAW